MLTIQTLPEYGRRLTAWVRVNLPTLLFGFIGVSAVLIVVFVLLQLIFGQQVQESTPAIAIPQFDNRTYRLQNISYSGNAITIPGQLAIYRAESTTPDMLAYATTLAQRLGMQKHEKLNNLWRTEDKQTTLGAELERGFFSYSSAPAVYEDLDRDFSTARAITAANDFLKQLGLNTDLVRPVTEEMSYLSDHGEPLPQNTRENAQIFYIPFAFTLNDYPVLMRQQNITRMTIYVDNTYRVTKALFFPFTFENIQEEKLVETVSVNQAIQAIKSGNYSVINVSQTRGDLSVLENFSEVDFSRAVVEYRYLPDQQRLYPFYRFTGVGIVEETYLDVAQPEKAATLEIITPAINTTQTTENENQ